MELSHGCQEYVNLSSRRQRLSKYSRMCSL